MIDNDTAICKETPEMNLTSENKTKAKNSTLVAILMFSLLANALTRGPMRSVNIFFLPFQDDLNANTRETASVRSIMFGLLCFCGMYMHF